MRSEESTLRISDTRRVADAGKWLSCQIRIKIRKRINICMRGLLPNRFIKKTKNRSYCHVPLQSVSIPVKKELLPLSLITIFLVSRMSVNRCNLLVYVLFCFLLQPIKKKNRS